MFIDLQGKHYIPEKTTYARVPVVHGIPRKAVSTLCSLTYGANSRSALFFTVVKAFVLTLQVYVPLSISVVRVIAKE